MKREDVAYPLATAVCCREWPVYLGLPIRACGLCHEVPVVRRG